MTEEDQPESMACRRHSDYTILHGSNKPTMAVPCSQRSRGSHENHPCWLKENAFMEQACPDYVRSAPLEEGLSSSTG